MAKQKVTDVIESFTDFDNLKEVDEITLVETANVKLVGKLKCIYFPAGSEVPQLIKNAIGENNHDLFVFGIGIPSYSDENDPNKVSYSICIKQKGEHFPSFCNRAKTLWHDIVDRGLKYNDHSYTSMLQ